MDRRTQISVALLVVVLAAVAGGLWRRQQATIPPAPAQSPYRVLTSGLVEAAAEHRAVLTEAMQVPKEVEAAQAQSRGVQAPPIVHAEPPTERAPSESVANAELAAVPPSQQVLIGFSGGEIGETDPCG